MAKKNDNINSAIMTPGEERSGGAPAALILAILFVALIIAGGMFLWFDILGARTTAIAFLQKIEPESQIQETWLDNQYSQLAEREASIDEREKEISRREKEQDALQIEMAKREEAFLALQEDEESPIYQNAVYLGEVFAGMTPEIAALQLQEMDDQDQIKRVLRTMPIESVIAIMEIMPEDFAAELELSILGEAAY